MDVRASILNEIKACRVGLQSARNQYRDSASKVGGFNRRVSEACEKVKEAGGIFGPSGRIVKASLSPFADDGYRGLCAQRVAVLGRCGRLEANIFTLEEKMRGLQAKLREERDLMPG